MDHDFQMEFNSGAEHPMLEARTALAHLAGNTPTVRLGALVTGVPYRHPGLLDKISTILDVVSGGRATDLDWIHLAPPPGIGPGERTGRFRRGGRELLQIPDGTLPGISFDDYAIAIVDELESPFHIRDRFTVAY